jgi:hypothetical protein
MYLIVFSIFILDGTLYILPTVGFTIQTNFLLSCQKFIDDNTLDFQYKFTYLDQSNTGIIYDK